MRQIYVRLTRQPDLKLVLSGKKGLVDLNNIIRSIKMDYEKLCEMLDSPDEQERAEAELEIMGRLLYYPGD